MSETQADVWVYAEEFYVLYAMLNSMVLPPPYIPAGIMTLDIVSAAFSSWLACSLLVSWLFLTIQTNFLLADGDSLDLA